MALYKWKFESTEHARNRHTLYKIAKRWTNLCISSTFASWHNNTCVVSSRTRELFQHFAKEVLHAETELQTFALFGDTISLQIAKMKSSEYCLRSLEDVPEIVLMHTVMGLVTDSMILQLWVMRIFTGARTTRQTMICQLYRRRRSRQPDRHDPEL